MHSTTRETQPDAAGVALFLGRWLANPLQMGSIVPSSPALCRRVVQQVRRTDDEWVIELGAGPGVVPRATGRSAPSSAASRSCCYQ